MPLLPRLARKLVARIGDKRRSGIADQGDRLALRETTQQFWPDHRGIMVVVGANRSPDPVVIKQLAAPARILARNHVGGSQHLRRTERDIAQIADRRGDQVEAGRKWRCRGGMPIKDIAAARALPPERERRGFGCAGSHLAAV